MVIPKSLDTWRDICTMVHEQVQLEIGSMGM